MKTKKMVMVLAAMAALGSVSMANAGGFLGDLIENACGGCGVGKVADKWNAQNNNVFDHAAAKVVNGIVPGAGVALEAGWAIQRGNFGGMPPHCRENKPFSNSNQSLVSPMVTRLGPVGFSQRPDPVRTFAGELAEDTFKQAKT